MPRTATKAKPKPEAPTRQGLPPGFPGLCKTTAIPLSRGPMPMARRFVQIATAIWTEACTNEGLSQYEFAVIGALRREPGLDQIGLAARLGVDRTNIGLIIDQMEKDGLVERSVNPNDRRGRLLTATEAGLAAFVRQAPQTAAAREKIFAPLTAAERETFLDLLERIIAANEAYSVPGAGRRKRSR